MEANVTFAWPEDNYDNAGEMMAENEMVSAEWAAQKMTIFCTSQPCWAQGWDAQISIEICTYPYEKLKSAQMSMLETQCEMRRF